MTLDLEQPHFPPDAAQSAESASASASDQSSSSHGTVETCEFEDLLERAMEILRVRRAGAGAKS